MEIIGSVDAEIIGLQGTFKIWAGVRRRLSTLVA